ncbi:MAG TPA: PTS sugar transporter subunit IIA [Acetobacteraceae bacterium]|nr:PTS sugar transporter subunit IIA [Acetobacteraceae bacterium]
MSIGDLIGPAQVVVGLRVADKAQLLNELSRRAAAALSLEQAVLLRALQAREQLGSTGLGRGFALPHARLSNLPRIYALLARLGRPIDYDSVDDKPVDLVVLLLTPESAAGRHLATLAALSRPFRDEGFVQQIRKAPDAAALHRVLAGV